MPLDLEWLRAQLPEHRILWRAVTESTMIDAAGCAPGTLALAEEQTAGQGRLGRKWHSERETGLYVSAVLRLDLRPVVTLALGLAVQEAIASVAGVHCDLRWPNDVLIGERKCAGILAQNQGEALIAGIGVNVNQSSFPPELESLATSLRLATGRTHSREEILVELVRGIDRYGSILEVEGPNLILERFARVSSYVSGRRVVVKQGGARVAGVTAGLDSSGFLLLRQDDGAEKLIRAGGVRPA